jgi:hypothetical protein
MNYADLKSKQYTPKKKNEIVWAYRETEDSPGFILERVVVFRLATLAEKKAFVNKEVALLEEGEEVDMSSYEEFLQRDSYLIHDYSESEMEMLHPDYIIAPAFNEKEEPLDAFGNPMPLTESPTEAQQSSE